MRNAYLSALFALVKKNLRGIFSAWDLYYTQLDRSFLDMRRGRITRGDGSIPFCIV